MKTFVYLLLALFAKNSQQKNILRNADFESYDWPRSNEAPTGWCEDGCCDCLKMNGVSDPKKQGSYALLVSQRTKSWAGPSQILGSGFAGKTYEVGAWLKLRQAGATTIDISIHYKASGQDKYGTVATIDISDTEWHYLKAKYVFPHDATSSIRFYIETRFGLPPPYPDFYVDEMSLEGDAPLPHVKTINAAWVNEANTNIDKFRKRDIEIVVKDQENLVVSLRQTRLGFPMGTAVSPQLIHNAKYRQIFFDNFNYAVCENAMKWTENEPQRYNEKYDNADQMMKILESKNIPVRGHAVFWGVDQFVQNWIKNLPQHEVWTAMAHRIYSLITRYKGRIQHWDVNNEMLHGNFYRKKLGTNSVIPWMFKEIRKYDKNVKLFLNDYNIIYGNWELGAYKQQARDLINQGADIWGIGLQSHWGRGSNPDYNNFKGILWSMSEVKRSLWLTEVDVQEANEGLRADKLETVIRTAFSHQSVDGILLWGFWANAHWRGNDGALWASDWRITEAGKRWQALMREWRTDATYSREQMQAAADGTRKVKVRAFHGTYDLFVNGEKVKSVTVDKGQGTQTINI